MSYSYSNPLTYGQPQGVYANNTTAKKSSALPYGISGAVVGGIGGGILGYKKNPFLEKNGEATDTFSKHVYEKFIDKADDAVKNAYNQKMEIYKEIDGIKNADDLRALFAAKPEAKLHLEPDFLNNVDANNLTESKKVIKETIEADKKASLQNLKNKVKSFWDADAKKFVKPDGADENIFNAINDAKKGVKFKSIAKFAAIGAAAVGVFAIVLSKLFSKNNPNV